MPEAQEFSTESIQSRNFKLEGPEIDIDVHQKGRVIQLTDPDKGQNAYFIDVTDRKDPSRTDIGRQNDDLSGDKISETYKKDLEDPEYNDRYGMWQGMSMLITDKLDEQGRKKFISDFQSLMLPILRSQQN